MSLLPNDVATTPELRFLKAGEEVEGDSTGKTGGGLAREAPETCRKERGWGQRFQGGEACRTKGQRVLHSP